MSEYWPRGLAFEALLAERRAVNSERVGSIPAESEANKITATITK